MKPIERAGAAPDAMGVANAQNRMPRVFAAMRATKKPGKVPGFREIVTLLKRLVYSKPAFLSVLE